MSSNNIFTFFVGAASIIIIALSFLGSLKEGKDSFKKLNEHLDEKEKRQKEAQLLPSNAHHEVG